MRNYQVYYNSYLSVGGCYNLSLVSNLWICQVILSCWCSCLICSLQHEFSFGYQTIFMIFWVGHLLLWIICDENVTTISWSRILQWKLYFYPQNYIIIIFCCFYITLIRWHGVGPPLSWMIFTIFLKENIRIVKISKQIGNLQIIRRYYIILWSEKCR